MSDQFLGEIRMFGGNFAPYQWATCDGQLLPISQNSALFSLLGTYYGGNGTSNFGLPNLKAAGPLDYGDGPGLTPRDLGEMGGEPSVTLLTSEMPFHNHLPNCAVAAGNSTSPVGAMWAENKKSKAALPFYSDSVNSRSTMLPTALGTAGGNLSHNNLAPYLVVTFIIALNGNFPVRG